MKSYKEMTTDLLDGLRESVIYTFVAGILAHGVMMFNKLSWKVDLNRGFVNDQEKAIGLGRWLKALLNSMVAKAFGGKNLSLPLEAPEVVSYDLNRSEWYNIPIEVKGSRLTPEARDMLSKARRDETLYLDNVKVLLPDGRTVTLKAQFPLK